ncbi:MAG: hypothetical protein WKF71_17625 [Pyrinomonadaceae bacterium]
MNENNVTQTEAERKAVDAVINILLLFLLALTLVRCRLLRRNE